jgi:hypothetical protein
VDDVRDFLPGPSRTNSVVEDVLPTKYIGAKMKFNGKYSNKKKFTGGFIGFIALLQISGSILSDK